MTYLYIYTYFIHITCLPSPLPQIRAPGSIPPDLPLIGYEYKQMYCISFAIHNGTGLLNLYEIFMC